MDMAVDVEDPGLQRRFRKQPDRLDPSAQVSRGKRKAPPQPPPDPTFEDDGVSFIGATDKRPARRCAHVVIKQEDPDDGLIRCPSCKGGITVSTRGCSLITCRAEVHRPGYFYFCYHCRKPLGDGIPCVACPERNDHSTRSFVKQRRNAYNADHPIVLGTSDDEDEAACEPALHSLCPGSTLAANSSDANTSDEMPLRLPAATPVPTTRVDLSFKQLVQFRTDQWRLCLQESAESSCWLLALPSDLLRAVLSLASVRVLACLACASQTAARAVDLHGEALLKQMRAIASTNRWALLTGAGTIYRLARLCGRRPIVPAKFQSQCHIQIQDFMTSNEMSFEALELLFLAVGDLYHAVYARPAPQQNSRDVYDSYAACRYRLSLEVIVQTAMTHAEHGRKYCCSNGVMVSLDDVERSLAFVCRHAKSRASRILRAPKGRDDDFKADDGEETPDDPGILINGEWWEDRRAYFWHTEPADLMGLFDDDILKGHLEWDIYWNWQDVMESFAKCNHELCCNDGYYLWGLAACGGSADLIYHIAVEHVNCDHSNRTINAFEPYYDCDEFDDDHAIAQVAHDLARALNMRGRGNSCACPAVRSMHLHMKHIESRLQQALAAPHATLAGMGATVVEGVLPCDQEDARSTFPP